jgi:hypothetical protein
MDLNPSLQEHIVSLTSRIVNDFGLAKRPPAERTEFLNRIASMVTQGALLKAMDLLSDADAAQAETIVGDAAAVDPERAARAIAFVVSRVPSYPSLLDQEYEVVKDLALKSMDTRVSGVN